MNPMVEVKCRLATVAAVLICCLSALIAAAGRVVHKRIALGAGVLLSAGRVRRSKINHTVLVNKSL